MQIVIRHVDVDVNNTVAQAVIKFEDANAHRKLRDWLAEHGNTDLRLHLTLGEHDLRQKVQAANNELARLADEQRPHSSVHSHAVTMLDMYYNDLAKAQE